MPGFHHSVAVLPLPLRKFRKNYVGAVIAYVKNPLRRCRSHLPLRRNCRSVANRIESYFLPFCRRWTTNQHSGHFIRIQCGQGFRALGGHSNVHVYETNNTARIIVCISIS